MRQKEQTITGRPTPETTPREERNRALARKAVAESIVLISNDGILPLEEGARIALMGSGASQTVKGGTGSGDVNEREVVSVYAGLKAAGYRIVNEGWLAEYDAEFERARTDWRDAVLVRSGSFGEGPQAIFESYSAMPFERPLGRSLSEKELKEADTDTIVYVISRNAGEGADRKAEAGDYYLSQGERTQISELKAAFGKMVIVLNCGGPIDLAFLDDLGVNAVIQLSQPGMEGGNALADIIKGSFSPCGKTTDSWARRYEDYPNASTFSHMNGNVEDEEYLEGIFVGYRYFDTFGIAPRIPFGFGLSYTDFAIRADAVEIVDGADGDKRILVRTAVTNTGSDYSGKEVVQVYACCPWGRLAKEYQRLCAFGKTPLLAPGETCVMTMSFPVSQLASFHEKESAWLLEEGDYIIAVGNSSSANEAAARIRLDKTVRLLETDSICLLRKPLKEIVPDDVPARIHGDVGIELTLEAKSIKTRSVAYSVPTMESFEDSLRRLVDSLSLDQLLALTSGDPNKGQDTSTDELGTSEKIVPGAAGGTSECASSEPWNIASIVLADGPAGLRLSDRYVLTESGNILKPDFVESIEHGIFAKPLEVSNGRSMYQYCTAFPIGTMLAQSWDTGLMEAVGNAVAEEMEEFGITLWLAPGMNIHRNPLCGRNFEYFSEDPLLAGMMASAITTGVQRNPGVGTTIKHLACNNQEANRKHSNSIVSERALREIYLHGFEIAVKHSQPMAIMTSYNLINGVHTANSYDLITKVARDEWGFAGFIVSDWTTTGDGGSSAVECIRAGNDLIMPGYQEDKDRIRAAVEGSGEESLDLEALKICAARLVRVILLSNRYLECSSYSSLFAGMEPFVDCRILQ